MSQASEVGSLKRFIWLAICLGAIAAIGSLEFLSSSQAAPLTRGEAIRVGYLETATELPYSLATATRMATETAWIEILPLTTPTRSASPTPQLALELAGETLAATPRLAPSPQPTYSPWRSTPLTLMLHRSSVNFDAVSFLRDFLGIVQSHELRLTTYMELQAHPDLSAQAQGKLMIITIDDVSLQAPIHASVQEMIALLRAAGYPAVLGVVTEGKLPDPATAAMLKELSDLGWEIASHTDTHVNLLALERQDPIKVRFEVRRSQDRIEAITGIRPITLILPEGQMVDNARLLYKEKIRWAVGITGGERFDVTDLLIYVGREGPTTDALTTFEMMDRRFNPGQ